MLEAEYEYFEKNKEAIAKAATKRFVVIVGQSVVAEFDDKIEAVKETAKSRPLGTFLVMDTEPEHGIHRFHSRVSV